MFCFLYCPVLRRNLPPLLPKATFPIGNMSSSLGGIHSTPIPDLCVQYQAWEDQAPE